MHNGQSAPKPRTAQQFMILSRINLQLQKVVDSQSQQIALLNRNISDLRSQNLVLTNLNDELRVKLMEKQANQEKTALIKEALVKDFDKFKEKMRQYYVANLKLQTQITRQKQQSLAKQLFVKQLQLQIQMLNKEVKKLNQHIKMYRNQNEEQRLQLRELKIQNLDNTLQYICQQSVKPRKSKENVCYVPKMINNKTVKKMSKITRNASHNVSSFVVDA